MRSNVFFGFLWFFLLRPHLISTIALPTNHVQHHSLIIGSSFSAPNRAITTVPSQRDLIRRSARNPLVGWKTDDVGNGWLAHYEPLQALVPSQQSAAALEAFYSHLSYRVVEFMQNGIPASQGFMIGRPELWLRFQSNVPVEWPIMLNFLSWIVSPQLF